MGVARRVLWAFILTSAVALNMSARSRFQGYVSQGGQRHQNSGIFAITRSGSTQTNPYSQQSYPNATVTVCQAGLDCIADPTKRATIYSNVTGTVLANPFTATSTGYFSFFGDFTSCDLRFSGGGISTPFTWAGFTVGGGGGATSTVAPPPSGGDDYAAIQAVVNTVGAAGGTIDICGTYLFSQELQIPAGLTHKLTIRGCGAFYGTPFIGTVFKATAPMRSVLAVLSGSHDFYDVILDANHLATNSMLWSGTSFSYFYRVYTVNAVVHGIKSDALFLNQDNKLDMCAFQNNGTTYATSGIIAQLIYGATIAITGTATTTSGNSVVTIVGGPDLTTLPIHIGSVLRVGSVMGTSFYGAIASVTATTITLQPVSGGNTPSITAAGQQFAIGVGDGVHEDRAGTNGACIFVDCISRYNGNANYFFNSLYGNTLIHGQSDFANLAAYEYGSTGPVLGTVIDHVYSEGNAVDHLLIAVNDLDIRDPTPNSSIFMLNDTAIGQTGTITRNGQVEQIGVGVHNNFGINVQNLAGQLQVRFLGELWGTFASSQISKLNAPPVVFTNLPAITAGVGFGAAAAGVLVASPLYLLLDTPNAQNTNTSMSVNVEANSTGTDLGASFSTISQNIGGVTINRTGIFLMNRTTGARVNWDTTTIPAGKFVFVRVDGMFR